MKGVRSIRFLPKGEKLPYNFFDQSNKYPLVGPRRVSSNTLCLFT